MKKNKEWIPFSENDSNSVGREVYDYFKKRNNGFQQKETLEDIRRRLSQSPLPQNTCASKDHEFVRIDEFTGGIKYKCKKCGLEAAEFNMSGEFDKAFFGSYINGHSHKWHSEDMEIDKIVQFSVSFGDYPIRNITFENGKLIYKNSINGSRDGWMMHPEGFFESHSITLNNQQIETILCCLQEIGISTWETDPYIFNNIGACGFCLHNTFKCTFKNGRVFTCYSPSRYSGFNKLTTLLSNLCGFAPVVCDMDSDNREEVIECCGNKYTFDVLYCHVCGKKLRSTFAVPGQKKIKAIVTDCCSIHIQEDLSFCPKCGKRIENKEKLIHLEVDYDPDQTSWLCECLHSNACEHQYCSNCGKKRPF